MKRRAAMTCVRLALCVAACNAAGAELADFRIDYDVRLASIGAGNGIVRLEVSDNRLLYVSTVTPRGLISTLFGDTLQIRSQSRLEDGRLVAEEYVKEHARSPDKDQRYRFEAHGHAVEVLKKGRVSFLSVPPGTLDEASVQLQLTLDVAMGDGPWRYAVISNGKLKHYRFTRAGAEKITTALGEIETLLVERARLHGGEDDELDHRYWLSPAHGYLPVKVERVEDGRVKRTLTATQLRRGEAVR